jgi:hypothetical protein
MVWHHSDGAREITPERPPGTTPYASFEMQITIGIERRILP